VTVHLLARTVNRIRRSQLPVQALTRLSSVVVFLVASWTDHRHLALVALQGVLFAIPYTLVEALVGRPLSAGLIPADWDVDRWAGRAAAATVLPVAAVSYLSASFALPGVTVADRALMIAPVLVQLPLEAAFWAWARTRPRYLANLVPQLTSLGTMTGAALFGLLGLRLDLASLPAQLLVLAWVVWLRQRSAVPGRLRPGAWPSVRVGAAYCLAAGVDLGYAVALPAIAGQVAGAPAIVVLRAMELVFGPVNVALAASIREDIVEGDGSRVLTGARALTVALLAAVSAVVLGSGRLRYLVATELGTAGLAPVCAYCGYKAVTVLSSWMSVRHMIWAPPGRYLVSAIGSRVLAFAGVAASLLWAGHLTGFFAQLLAAEVVVVSWYYARMRGRPAGAGQAPAQLDRRALQDPVDQPADQQHSEQGDQHEDRAARPAGQVAQQVDEGRVEQVDRVADGTEHEQRAPEGAPPQGVAGEEQRDAQQEGGRVGHRWPLAVRVAAEVRTHRHDDHPGDQQVQPDPGARPVP
jgi:hypothetical protein